MNFEDIKALAVDAADGVIDRYLDVIDLSEEVDLTQFNSEDAETFAEEVGSAVRLWVLDSIRSAREEGEI
jgi:hypothetical protein